MPTTRSQTRAATKARRTATTTATKTPQKPGKKRKQEQPRHAILINRAPVLTLWAAIVAEHEGFSWNEGLTYGRWISGTLAQSKGRSLGIYEPHEKTEAEKTARRRRDIELGVHKVKTFGMHVPVVNVNCEQLAVSSQDKPIDPDTVYSYLLNAFKGEKSLKAAKEAMKVLAESIPSTKEEDGEKAGQRVYYALYEQFRPEWKGWGGKGHLDLNLIRNLAQNEA